MQISIQWAYKVVITVGLLFNFANLSISQEVAELEMDDTKIIFFEFGGECILPQQNFKKNLKKDLLFGGQIAFLKQLRSQKPIFWGVEYGYTRYGSANASFEELIDFNVINFDYHTYANMQKFLGTIRLYPAINFPYMDPYLEIQAGGRWLLSATTKTNTDIEDGTSDFFSESSAWSWTYVFSSGFNFKIGDFAYINLKGSYQYGTRVKYLVDDNLEIIGSSVDAFSTYFSPLSNYAIQLGITMTNH
jgi:hypothetical protein